MNRHRVYMSIFLVVISFALLAGASARANTTLVGPKPADVKVDKDNQNRTIDCAGGSVTVDGNGNVLVLKGDCTTLKVNGNDNTVTVEVVAEIATLGNRNKVTWAKGAGGKPPKISNPGTRNTIKKAGQ